MAIIGTFNGVNIIALPSDTMPNVTAPSSIEFDPQEKVEWNTSIYTGQTQTYDLMCSFWSGTISLPPMHRYDADAWQSFVLACRGMVNCFLLGDPTTALPKGVASGSPVVSGAGQTGYSLVTRGWTPSTMSLLRAGDYIQIGSLSTLSAGFAPRLYRLTDNAVSDGSGNATLSVWPNLRDLPADGTAINTRNCVGLMRLSQNQGNSYSTTPGTYGVTGLKFREAI
jgi:hypothetical protein